MDLNAVLTDLDSLFSHHMTDKIEGFLTDNIRAAMAENDSAAVLSLVSELVGFYRDSGEFQKCAAYADSLLKLCESFGISGTVPHATALLNAANAFRAVGDHKRSAECFDECFRIYSENLPPDDMRISGYYNNLSLLFQETGDFESSCNALKKALSIAEENHADIEAASACANLSASLLNCGKTDEAEKFADRSLALFKAASPDENDFHFSAALAAKAAVCAVKGDNTAARKYYEAALTELHMNTGFSSGYVRLLERYADLMHKMQADISGLAFSERYFNEYGREMLGKFSGYESDIAVGLLGEGSDVLGYDDIYSRDHDFGAGFAIFISRKTYSEIGAELEAAYDALPAYCGGVPKAPKTLDGQRRGVIIYEDFFRRLTGLETPPETESEWLYAYEYGLAALSGGKLFYGENTVFADILRRFRQYYPENIRRKKLADALINAAQNGQYNLPRAVKRHDLLTAQLCSAKFAEYAISAAFAINRRFAPIVKWQGRMLSECGYLAGLPEMLERFLSENDICERISIAENISLNIAETLRSLSLTSSPDSWLEAHGKELLMKDKVSELANDITMLEWEFFDKVKNIGGRASCQDDFPTFEIMRKSQYLTWDIPMLESWKSDLMQYKQDGGNPITLKYAYMMAHTSPDEFAAIKDSLPPVDDEKRQIIDTIAGIQVGMMNDFAAKYPKLAENARSITDADDSIYNTSYETYLKGELAAYSPETLKLYGYFIVRTAAEGGNIAEKIMLNTVHFYGYKSLDDAESRI